jgi:hypothetical protein
MVPNAQRVSKQGENIVDVRKMEFGWEWTGNDLGGLLLWVNKFHARSAE